MRKLSFIVILLALSLFPGISFSELVTNGGFETGDFTGWTVTPAPVGSDFGVSTAYPHTGLYAAYFGAVSTYNDSISQALATIPGQAYTLTYSLTHPYPASANDFQVTWGGTTLQDLIDYGSFPYNTFTLDVTATSTPTILQFSGLEVPAFYYLDDVSVTGAAAEVPEPTTMLLLGSGLIGLAGYGRKKFFKK